VSPKQGSAESLRLPLEINGYFEILRKIPEVLQNVGKAKCLGKKVKVKVNQSRYRPGMAQRVPGS